MSTATLQHEQVYDRRRGNACKPDCVACRQSDMFATPKPEPSVAAVRTNRRTQIADFFAANLGTKFTSSDMHSRFGSAFRTRVSEINRDEFEVGTITIRSEVKFESGVEKSRYWGEAR